MLATKTESQEPRFPRIFTSNLGSGYLLEQLVQIPPSSMAANTLIFAKGRPIPEICLENTSEVSQKVVAKLLRSDFLNQRNNLIGFPYI